MGTMTNVETLSYFNIILYIELDSFQLDSISQIVCISIKEDNELNLIFAAKILVLHEKTCLMAMQTTKLQSSMVTHIKIESYLKILF